MQTLMPPIDTQTLWHKSSAILKYHQKIKDVENRSITSDQCLAAQQRPRSRSKSNGSKWSQWDLLDDQSKYSRRAPSRRSCSIPAVLILTVWWCHLWNV